MTALNNQLTLGLQRIQSTGLDLALVPLNNNKQPLGDGWQNRPYTATQLIEAIQNGGVEVPIKGEIKKIQLQGFGVITGTSLTTEQGTYTLMAVDLDGASATNKMLELSGSNPLPPTVAFTSTRPGRCQYLFLVPEKLKNLIRTKKIKTGVVGDDGKPEQIELRYSNLQSVLPPSVHPTTGKYHWVEGCAIDEIEIALAPSWIIEQMLIEKAPQIPPPLEPLLKYTTLPNNSNKQWNDIDFAISYLNALSPYRADDYDDWVAVGMALHSVDDSLLTEWDNWSRSSSKYNRGDCEKKWKSFSRGGGVKLGTLAHLAKLDGWTFPRQNTRISSPVKKPLQSIALTSTDNETTVTGDTSKRSDTSNTDRLSPADTVTAVTAILKLGLPDYEEQNELDLLQTYSTLSQTAFWQLVRAIRCCCDEIQLCDTDRFNQLVNWHNATLDLKKIIPPLAPVFIHDASVLNIDPISLWQYFLPTVLSLAGKRLDLDIESHRIPAIAWTCLVGESGTGKTRAEGVILAPLKQRQYQEKKRWKNALAEYKQILKNKKKEDPEPFPPTPERKYLFEVATIQSVMRRLAEQTENGSLWARDEIAGLFKSLGQFGGSKEENEGLECLLKMWDGSGSFVDRVDPETDSYAVEETRLSIAGGIQPGAFRQAFKDPDDPQGVQARFLYAIPQVCKPKRVKGYCQLSDILPPLYDWLSNLPVGTVKLSRDADKYYSDLVEFLGEKAESHPHPAIRAWLRKLSTQILRIALGIHLVDCYFDKTKNIWVLQLNTLERAVEAGRYYSQAMEVVQEKVGNSENMSSILLKIWDMSVNVPEGVTPRDIYRNIKAISKRAVECGRSVGAYTIELFSKLVEMGKGIIEKNGRIVRFKAIINPPPPPYNPNNPPNNPNNPNPPTAPTPPTPAIENINSDGQGNSQSDDNNYYVGAVTEVTQPQNPSEQELEASPNGVVSPVTEVLSSDLTKKENINWLITFLADLEDTTVRRFSSIEEVLQKFSLAEERSVEIRDELLTLCPNYFERLSLALGTVSDQFSVDEKDSISVSVAPLLPPPSSGLTVASIQGLLLACKTLSDYNSLKKKHNPQLLEKAYMALPEKQQLIVDGLLATSFPEPVFKYKGKKTGNPDGFEIKPGMLVYLDSEARQGAYSVKVWALNGVKQGQHQPVFVTRFNLEEVKKSNPTSESSLIDSIQLGFEERLP